MSETDLERAKTILKTYGAQSSHWPESERAMMSAQLKSAPLALKEALEAAQWLDTVLDTNSIEACHVTEAFMPALDSRAGNIIAFNGQSLPRPKLYMAVSLALAASLSGIVFGLSLASNEISQLHQIAVLQEAQLLSSEADL